MQLFDMRWLRESSPSGSPSSRRTRLVLLQACKSKSTQHKCESAATMVRIRGRVNEGSLSYLSPAHTSADASAVVKVPKLSFRALCILSPPFLAIHGIR